MKTSENITIVVLAVSAAILLASLAGSHFGGDPTALAATPFRHGDYVVCTGAYTADRDVLYVLRPSARRLNVYAINTETDSIDIVDSVDVAAALER